MSNKEKTIAGSIVTLVTLLTMGIVVFLATSEESDSRAGITTAGTDGPLRQIQDWEDLRTKLSDQLTDWLLQQHGLSSASKPKRPALQGLDAMSAPTSRVRRSAAKAGSGRSGPSHYTGTNNQVTGVEEADIVQTDGKYIYTIHKRQLVIIKSWPAAQTAIVARHRLDAGAHARELYVSRDRLVILSRGHGAKTRITVLDITRRSQPRVVKEIDLGGQLGQSRLIGRKLYLVTTSPMRLPRAVYRAISNVDWTPLNDASSWDPARPAAVALVRSQVSRRIRQALDRRDIERLLPQA